jgi:hypothetical protein
MSQIHTYLNNYIQALQTLQAQYSGQALLDAAEKKWGADSPEYMILLEKPNMPHRWIESPNSPSAEVPKSDDEPNILISIDDWLPTCISSLQNVVAQNPDDDALSQTAQKRWGLKSYVYLLLVKAGLRS